MADTVFVDGVTVTAADWFNDLNRLHYTLLGDPADLPALKTVLSVLLNGSVTKTADYTVVAADRGKVIQCTNPLTLSLTAAGTLGDGFPFGVVNGSTGVVTLDPNSTETIDTESTIKLMPGETCICYCNGTAWRTFGRVHKSGCFVYQSTTTSLTAATVVPIGFDVEGYDEFGWHDNVTNNTRITVSEAGRYLINCCITAAGTQDLTAILRVNGADITTSCSDGHLVSGGAAVQAQKVQRLAAGDYVELFGYSDGTRSTTAGVARTFLQVERIG